MTTKKMQRGEKVHRAQSASKEKKKKMEKRRDESGIVFVFVVFVVVRTREEEEEGGDQRPVRHERRVRTNSKKKRFAVNHDKGRSVFKITARKIDAMGRFEGEERDARATTCP